MKRWVPYNGGVGEQQLLWLESVLKQSLKQSEKVIIFSHQPIWTTTKPQSLIWNSEDILSILHKYGNVIVWMAGHDHGGQYDIDPKGIHHIVPPAPIESEILDQTYGDIRIYEKSIVLNWNGEIPDDTVIPFRNQLITF